MAAAASYQYGAIRKIDHHDHIKHVAAANVALAVIPADSPFWIVHWMYQEFAKCDGCGTHDHHECVLIDNYGNSHCIQAEMPYAPWLNDASPFPKWLETTMSFYRDTDRKPLDDPAIDVVKQLPTLFGFSTFATLSTDWLQAFATYTHTYATADPTDLVEWKREEEEEEMRAKMQARSGMDSKESIPSLVSATSGNSIGNSTALPSGSDIAYQAAPAPSIRRDMKGPSGVDDILQTFQEVSRGAAAANPIFVPPASS